MQFDGRNSIYVAGGFTDSMQYGSIILRSPNCTTGDCNVPYVVRIDTNGTVLWGKAFNGLATGYTPSITGLVYAGGAAWVSGIFWDSLSVDTFSIGAVNPYTEHGFLARLNPAGYCTLLMPTGIPFMPSENDAIATDNENIYLLGNFADSLVFPGVTIRDTSTLEMYSSYIAKYDSMGNFKWVFGGTGQITGSIFASSGFSNQAMRYDRHGGLYIDGAFSKYIFVDSQTYYTPNTTSRNCIIKIDTGGHYIWSFSPSGYVSTGSTVGGSSLDADSSSFYLWSSFMDTVVAGADTIISNGSTDFMLTHYDLDHNMLSEKHFGGVGNEVPTDILYHNGTLYLSGFTYSNYLVDTFHITNLGYMDIFLAKMEDSVSSVLHIAEPLGGQPVVYPNPATGIANVMMGDNCRNLSLSTMSGAVIWTKPGSGKTEQIDLSGLPANMYVLRVVTDNACYIVKVVKD